MAKDSEETNRIKSTRRQVKRLDVLPDDVLLEIFDLCVDKRSLYYGKWVATWQLLVHVCRRWRSVVFGSPHRLNLQLFCTPKTPARDTLDLWPALPLIVRGIMGPASSTDNVIAALGQSNRVRVVDLHPEDWQLEEILGAMQVPFPELTDLQLSSIYETPPVIPDSFLDGSAPRLRYFILDNIPFPGLPNLLLSATHLVKLRLFNVPHSRKRGYISPEAMVAILFVLSSLETFTLQFLPQSRSVHWGSRRPPPPKRSVIPALTYFSFEGVVEYLGDLVTSIDAPQLDHFSTPHDSPNLSIVHPNSGNAMHVHFHDKSTGVVLPARSGDLV